MRIISNYIDSNTYKGLYNKNIKGVPIETEIKADSKIFIEDNTIPLKEYSSLNLPFQKVDKKEEADYIVMSDAKGLSYFYDNTKNVDYKKYNYTTTYFIIQSYINSIDFNLIEAFSNEELENIKNLNQELKNSLLESCWLKLLKSHRECIVKKNLINTFFPYKISRKKEEFRRKILNVKRAENRIKDCKILW
jgi:hypothetical protein